MLNSYYNFLAVEKYDSFDADNSGRDFLYLLQQGDPNADAFVPTLKSIIRMRGDVHDRNFLRRGAEKNNHANGISSAPVAIKRE